MIPPGPVKQTGVGRRREKERGSIVVWGDGRPCQMLQVKSLERTVSAGVRFRSDTIKTTGFEVRSPIPISPTNRSDVYNRWTGLCKRIKIVEKIKANDTIYDRDVVYLDSR